MIRRALRSGQLELDLPARELTTLPAEIGQLTNLQRLDLHNNNLTALPAELGQLTSLQYLNLSQNGLTALPAELGQLSNLDTLYLSTNLLTELPAWLGQLTGLQSSPGEYGLLEVGHPGGQAVQRQLAELVDDGGGRGVHMAAQQREAKDGRGRFGDAQELGRVVEVG